MQRQAGQGSATQYGQPVRVFVPWPDPNWGDFVPLSIKNVPESRRGGMAKHTRTIMDRRSIPRPSQEGTSEGNDLRISTLS